MNARHWMNNLSIAGRVRTENTVSAEVTAWDACWDRWDLEQACWRHYARRGSEIIETDEIGIALNA